jgi:MATE family multidrug resistance protein
VGAMGTDALAATNLAFNMNMLAFLPMMGFGTAVMTVVGQRIGEGRPQLAVRTTWTAFLISTGYMSAFAAIYVLLPDLILAPYAARSDAADFQALRETVIVLLRFVAVYSLFDTMNIVFSAAVRGAGDTRFALVFSTVTAWLVMVIPTYLNQSYWGGGLDVAWTAVTIFVIVLGLGFLVRFQGGKWKSMRVIEEERIPTPTDGVAGKQLVSPGLPSEPIPVEVPARTNELELRL